MRSCVHGTQQQIFERIAGFNYSDKWYVNSYLKTDKTELAKSTVCLYKRHVGLLFFLFAMGVAVSWRDGCFTAVAMYKPQAIFREIDITV